MSISTFVGTAVDLLSEKVTLGRIVFIGCCLLMLIGTVAIYEGYTAHFRLSRLERATEVTIRLAAAEKELAGTSSAALLASHQRLTLELQALVHPQFLVFNFDRGFYRMASTSCIWFLAGLAALRQGNGKDQWILFMGIILMSSPFVIAAGLIPSFRNFWADILIYPIGHILLFCYGAAFYLHIKKNEPNNAL